MRLVPNGEKILVDDIKQEVLRLVAESLKPSRQEMCEAIGVIIESLGFERVLEVELKVNFDGRRLVELTDSELVDVFQIVRTWAYMNNQGRESKLGDNVFSIESARSKQR